MFKSIKIVLVAVMLLTLASFAQNNEKKKERVVLHSFNIAFPMDWSGTWEQYSNHKYENRFTRDRDLKMDMTMGLQLRWMRDLIFQRGWSFEVGAGIGFIDFPVNDYKFDSRFDLNAKVGLGFAPIVNDFILAVHAFLGADLKYLGASYQEFEFTQEYSTLLFNFVGGVDVVLDYRITDRLGINAGVDGTMNLFGFGKRKFSYGFADEERETIDYKFEHVFSGFQVVPRVGVSLKF
jgi:hypothetical protein